MNYLNIDTDFIDGPIFVRSEPIDRATWLCLSAYCAKQENGGRIQNCREWGDRMWMQSAKVTLSEIRRHSELWAFDGDDLVISGYPLEQEAAYHSKSASATKAAHARWEKERAAERKHKQTQSTSICENGEPHAQNNADAMRTHVKPNADASEITSNGICESMQKSMRKGKERKGKKGDLIDSQVPIAPDATQNASPPGEASPSEEQIPDPKPPDLNLFGRTWSPETVRLALRTASRVVPDELEKWELEAAEERLSPKRVSPARNGSPPPKRRDEFKRVANLVGEILG